MSNMKCLKTLVAIGSTLFAIAPQALMAQSSETAVVYFSRFENAPLSTVDATTSASVAPDGKTGSTAYVASLIAKKTGADLINLKTESAYPASFRRTIDQNHSEQTQNILPKLQSVPDLSAYKTIFLGFPVWNMNTPQAIKTFLSQSKLAGKNIFFFVTHDGYGAGRSFNTVASLAKGASTKTDGLQIDSSSLNSAPVEVNEWLKQNTPVVSKTNVPIQVKVDGKVLKVVLNNTPEAQEFRSQFPLKVSMGEFEGREYYGSMPGHMKAVSKGQYTFEDGTLTYCPTNHTVAIFYAQSSRPHLTMAVYPMGKVVEGLEHFKNLGSYETFEFSE